MSTTSASIRVPTTAVAVNSIPTPTLTLLPTDTPEPTEIPAEWGRFNPWPMDGTCYVLDNSLCVGIRSVEWDTAAMMEDHWLRLMGRPPTGFNYVTVEIMLFNASEGEINTDDIWSKEDLARHLETLEREDYASTRTTVMGQQSNESLPSGATFYPESSEPVGCFSTDEPEIPEAWVDGAYDIYIPPGENLVWMPCFTVAEEDLSTLVLSWPHFIEGPPIWFALHPEP